MLLVRTCTIYESHVIAFSHEICCWNANQVERIMCCFWACYWRSLLRSRCILNAATYVCSLSSVYLFVLLLSTTTCNFVCANRCLCSTMTEHAECWVAVVLIRTSLFPCLTKVYIHDLWMCCRFTFTTAIISSLAWLFVTAYWWDLVVIHSEVIQFWAHVCTSTCCPDVCSSLSKRWLCLGLFKKSCNQVVLVCQAGKILNSGKGNLIVKLGSFWNVNRFRGRILKHLCLLHGKPWKAVEYFAQVTEVADVADWTIASCQDCKDWRKPGMSSVRYSNVQIFIVWSIGGDYSSIDIKHLQTFQFNNQI